MRSNAGSHASLLVLLISINGLLPQSARGAGTLSGSFSSIPRGTVVNLTAAGPLDWVHWGLYTESSVDRKAGVNPLISDFEVIYNSGDSNAYAFAYQFSDNYNGYSWSDGVPTADVTNTTTGVWTYGIPSIGSGFEITVPAGTDVRILKVYVGAFAGEGLFVASLSDGSAADYRDTSLINFRNGPSGVYTLTYAANSPGQTLKIRWTLFEIRGLSANVTLQAAALTGSGANNPPFASITSPTENSTFSTPGNITIAATATDVDGAVSKVEFYDGEMKLGEDTTSPYSFIWNNPAPGYHVLTAVATDTNGNFSSSMPVEIFVNGAGGALSGSSAMPPSAVDLSLEGTADWAHWGLSTNSSFDHKAGVASQISDFTALGTNPVERYADNFTAYSWTGGTPTPSATNTPTGIFITGVTNGFRIRAPADTTTRQLKVYVGLYGAQGNFQAYLSDFSAKAFTDTSLNNVFDNSYAVYTLTYKAASAGQSLIVQYRASTLYDFDFGNVTLQAATLVGTNSGPADVPPTVSIMSPTNGASFVAPANITIAALASDSDGSVSKVEFFQGTSKLGESSNSPYSLVWSNAASGSYALTARATDNLGVTTTSAAVDVTVLTSTGSPPVIIQQPSSLVVTQGSNATFHVSATGTPAPAYQWRFNQNDIPGAQATSYTVTNAQPANAGNYDAVVSNSSGSVTSSVATLTVRVPPSISAQPQSQTVNLGSNATFSVTASGTTPLSYQWRLNGATLPGGNQSSYTVTNAQPSNAGPYTVAITNVAGAVTSAPVTLMIIETIILGSAQHLLDGTFQFRVNGGSGGQTCIIDVTSALDDVPQLTSWLPIFTNTFPNTTSPFISFTDKKTNASPRFYRARVLP